jgi:hypothetical protein
MEELVAAMEGAREEFIRTVRPHREARALETMRAAQRRQEAAKEATKRRIRRHRGMGVVGGEEEEEGFVEALSRREGVEIGGDFEGEGGEENEEVLTPSELRDILDVRTRLADIPE